MIILDFMDYERPSVTADVVLFRIKNIEINKRLEDKKELQVLLIRREKEPYKGKWSLPGGFVGIEKTIGDTAKEKVLQKCGIKDFYLEQLYTFDSINRDSRWRVISTSYIGIAKQDCDCNKEGCNWFTIKNNVLISDNGILTISMDSLAFDHKDIIFKAIERMRGKLFYSNIAFEFLPSEFTIRELQSVFEVILAKSLTNFKRTIGDRVVETEKIYKGKACRPAKLFQKNPDCEQ